MAAASLQPWAQRCSWGSQTGWTIRDESARLKDAKEVRKVGKLATELSYQELILFWKFSLEAPLDPVLSPLLEAAEDEDLQHCPKTETKCLKLMQCKR